MAYQTGTVNSLADIQTVIRTFLVDNGWTWDAGSSTIHKDSVFVEISVLASDVRFRGATSLGAGHSSNVRVGRLCGSSIGFPTLGFTFPCTYYAFLNDDEFYFVIQYDVTRFQFVTFGKSSIDLSSSGGTGAFLSATGGSTWRPYDEYPFTTDSNGRMDTNGEGAISGGAFFTHTVNETSSTPSSFVHSNIDGGGWALRSSSAFDVGNSYQGSLLGVLPNMWNQESPLLPVRAYRVRPESKVSLVLDLQHARHCRVDNFNDAEIITIGVDQWQVFPHHRRNTASRNGGRKVDHTGMFGWAIRKVD